MTANLGESQCRFLMVFQHSGKVSWTMVFAQDVHFPFSVASVLREAFEQNLTKSGPVGRDLIEARIKQLIKQQGVEVEVFGGPA